MLEGIFGDMGSGKNVRATWYILKWFFGFYGDAPIYDECFANFHVAAPPGSTRQVQLLTKDAFKSLEHKTNVLVVIDEAYLWLDSRRSMSKENVNVSYVVLQSRKRGFDVLYIAQVRSSVDLRLRELSEIWVYCEKRGDGFHYTVIWRGMNAKIMHEFLSKKAAEKVFPYFDTREIVSPV